MAKMAQDLNSDFSIVQNWQGYSEEEHATWRVLFERQQRLLVGRACQEFLDGLGALGVAAEGIPDFRQLSQVLDAATGWRIVAVPGLVPNDVFLLISPTAAFRRPASSGGATSSITSRNRIFSTTSAVTCHC
jgi:phenylalanine-4-hydroxylase